MFYKTAVVIVAITLSSIGLLELRHQRLELVYEMATIHRDVDRTRKSMWDSQTRIAHQLQPQRLEESITAAKLKLEPVHFIQSDGVDDRTERDSANNTDANPRSHNRGVVLPSPGTGGH